MLQKAIPQQKSTSLLGLVPANVSHPFSRPGQNNHEDTYTINKCLSVYISPSSLRKLQCILNDLRFIVSAAAVTCRGFVRSIVVVRKLLEIIADCLFNFPVRDFLRSAHVRYKYIHMVMIRIRSSVI